MYSMLPATQRKETGTAQSYEDLWLDTFPLRMWTPSSIICTVLIIHLVDCRAGSRTAESSLQQSQRTEAMSCDLAAFSDLYHAIDVDLSHWNKAGITQLLMDQSIEALGSMMSHKGIAIMFESGVAYIIRWGDLAMSDSCHKQSLAKATIYWRCLADAIGSHLSVSICSCAMVIACLTKAVALQSDLSPMVAAAIPQQVLGIVKQMRRFGVKGFQHL